MNCDAVKGHLSIRGGPLFAISKDLSSVIFIFGQKSKSGFCLIQQKYKSIREQQYSKGQQRMQAGDDVCMDLWPNGFLRNPWVL